MTLPGIDVSGYQTTTPTLTGLSFCIAKASEGLHPAIGYAMHIANTRAAGIATGAYHFARNDAGTPESQAAYFLSVAGTVDLYALDVEGPYAFTPSQSAAFIAAVQAAGKKCGMYHSLSGFPHVGQDWDWVAFYNPTPPPIPWTIWQYGPVVIDGHNIDGDTFYGDEADLQALIGGNMPPDPVKAEPVALCDVAATTGYLDDTGTQQTTPAWRGTAVAGIDLYYRAGPGSSSVNMPQGAACIRAPLVPGEPDSTFFVDDGAISNVRLIGAPPPVDPGTELKPGKYFVP